MAVHPVHQLDVFTDRPLTGNPLAVFPDARGLSAATMQALAREMNLSETAFVLPSVRATRRVRFFTPAAEVPLVGHPTIGTWWLLAELGMLDAVAAEGETTVLQETGRGVLPVDIVMQAGRPIRVVMTQASPEFAGPVRDTARLTDALGRRDVLAPDGPAPEVVSTAIPQLMVPVRSRDALTSLPSGGTGARLAATLRALGTDCVMLFAPPEDGTVHCRMFAPGLGVPEDPATGSASGALGAYLVHHGLVEPTGDAVTLVIEQGHEVGRPSKIQVEVRIDGGAITTVRVGGTAVTVLRGEVLL